VAPIRQRDRSSGWLTPFLWTSVAVASAYFITRGILRAWAPDGSGDFAYQFAASRAWLHGLDPYLGENLVGELLAGGGSLVGVFADLSVNVNPPTAMPLFMPLSVTGWDTSRLLLIGANAALTIMIFAGLARFLGWKYTAAPTLLVAAFVLALAPVHTALAAGQSGIVVTAALVWAMVLEAAHPKASGLLLGLATALKVTMGLPFLAYSLVRRRWLVTATASLVVGAIALVSVMRMQVASVPWLTSWTSQLAASLEPGGPNSSSLETSRASLINLQNPLTVLLGDETLATLLAICLVGAGTVATVLLVRLDDRPGLLLGMSLVASLTLLVTYHRYYDAVLLAFPVTWGAWAITASHRWTGAGVLLICGSFLLPLQTAALQLGGRLPAWVSDNVIWQAGLAAVHAWALALLVLVLLAASVTSRRISSADSLDALSPVHA
jgi:hypothetical protein